MSGVIVSVDGDNLSRAAEVHATAWRASHRAFCTPDFVEQHTQARQSAYILEKMNAGSAFYMLVEDRPVGVVSVTGSLIEDLYVLPDAQNRGLGTRLLRFAMERCAGTPTLWILENNVGAERLYRRHGFRRTGRTNAITAALNEIELALTPQE